MNRLDTITTVAEIRDEVAALAADLRAKKGNAEADRLESFNRSFWTTTTEYLVELLNVLNELGSTSTFQQPSIRSRVEVLREAARRLSNLK